MTDVSKLDDLANKIASGRYPNIAAYAKAQAAASQSQELEIAKLREDVDMLLRSASEPPDGGVPPGPPGGGGGGGPGVITYVHDYTAAHGQTTPPDYGWDWGVQYDSQPQSNFAIVANGIQTGLPSARITLNGGGGTASIEGLKKWPVVIGERSFYGYMVKFPSNWVEPSGTGWGNAINQLAYQGLANGPTGLFAHADHCQFVLLTGEHTWPDPNNPGIGTPIREYNNSEEGGTWPSAPRAITAPMALNRWHELIFDIQWSTCSTSSTYYSEVGVAGHVRVYHRLAGGGDWTMTIERTNIPTLQWGYGYNFGGGAPYWSVTANDGTANATHKFGAYDGGSSVQRQIEHGNISIGTSFDAVAALMP